ncbi:MAG: hypothetical protein FWE63_08550 [Bacteroidales bacterium]|nr:hypothetical protein [Bacteroidales bacterium]
MKKTFAILGIMVAIATVTSFAGCQKVLNIKTIDDELRAIENNMPSKILSINNDELSYSANNRDFFKALAIYLKENNEGQKNNDFPSLSDYPFQEEDVLSEAETKVLQSFFNAVNEEYEPYPVALYYIEQVEKMKSIDEYSKMRCLAFLTFVNDMYVFIYNDDDGVPQQGIASFDSCFDYCFFMSFGSVFYRKNWLRQLRVILQPGTAVLWAIGECMVDCM